MRTNAYRLTVVALSVVMSSCGGAATQPGPGNGGEQGDTLPGALQGEWHHGSVSPIEYYDPSSGRYAEASGTSIILKFGANGTFERTGITVVTTGSCTSKSLLRQSGVVKLEGSRLTLVPKTSYSKGYICSANQTYEDRKLVNSVNTWRLEGSGAQAVLALGDPNGQVRESLYNRPRGTTDPGGGTGRDLSGVVRIESGSNNVLGEVVIMACPASGTCADAGDRWRYTKPGNVAVSTAFTIRDVTDGPHHVLAWTDWNENGAVDKGDLFGAYTLDGQNLQPVTAPAQGIDITVHKIP